MERSSCLPDLSSFHFLGRHIKGKNVFNKNCRSNASDSMNKNFGKAEIESYVDLLYRVHKNFAKRISICIANGECQIEDAIRIKIKLYLLMCTNFYLRVHAVQAPSM